MSSQGRSIAYTQNFYDSNIQHLHSFFICLCMALCLATEIIDWPIYTIFASQSYILPQITLFISVEGVEIRKFSGQKGQNYRNNQRSGLAIS